MIPDSLAPRIVIRAPDKTSARESEDEAIARNRCIELLSISRKRELGSE